MSSTPQITLLNFYVYNASYGPKEGEEDKKIMYYYPPETDIDTKIRNIGLSEAIVKFTETFEPEKCCEAVHTQKTRQLYLLAEPGFWVIMTVSIPYTQKTKDGQDYIEYKSEDVQDIVFNAILLQAYNAFRLFMGTFQTTLGVNNNVQALIEKLEKFYSWYLPTLRPAEADILEVFCGLQFLPLERGAFLRVQSFVNLTEATFPQVDCSVFLFNDKVVWCGIEAEDMQVLFRYLITTHLSSNGEQHAGDTTSSRTPLASPFTNPHYGRFVPGPSNLCVSSKIGSVPCVHLGNKKTGRVPHHMVVYQALSATVCLFIKTSISVAAEPDLLRRMDAFLGPHLTALVSELAEQGDKRGTTAPDPQLPRYVYFNRLNLAQKSSAHTPDRKVSPDTLRLMADLSSDTRRLTTSGEMIAKSMTDAWVVSKLSDHREFYVVVHPKSSNLIEVNDEVRRLCATQFNNIFFHD